MWLSDTAVKKPVFATVVNLLVIAFGIIAFSKLPLREYPDIDPPVVSIEVTYTGAAANVVETRITQVIEERIAGIEGIKHISSTSQDGRANISVEFDISRNIDDAANDIRDRVSGVLRHLPEEADPPEIQKADSSEDVIMWLNLTAEGMSTMELTDYTQRYIEDRFSALDGIARIRIGGAKERSMRIWLSRSALAARNLTVNDVEQALRSENVELPAGSIESSAMDFTVRMERGYNTPDDFRQLVLAEGADGYLVRLGDVARVEVAPIEERSSLRGNGMPMVGIGVIKQSKANTLEVARAVKAEMARINESLPEGMAIRQSYDTSIFIERSVQEVYITLAIATFMVMVVIYAFLGNLRAVIVPAVTVPVSLIGTFIVLFAFGFSVNLLTLLALILAIGLVVDDAILVVENIHRRIEMGEPPLVAAFHGTRQVGFAIIATTLVLIAVFVPITFLEGDLGRLFSEFAVTIAGAVVLSSFVALTFSPMLASKLMKSHTRANDLTQRIDIHLNALRERYLFLLDKAIANPGTSLATLFLVLVAAGVLFVVVPREFAPKEDRGAFFMMIRGPEGASFEYTMEHVNEVEQRLLPYTRSGEFQRMLMRVPGSFGSTAAYNDARGIIVLSDWSQRKPIDHYLREVREKTADITGVRISSVLRQAFGGGTEKPVQFVIGGPDYAELAKWRDIILAKAEENPRLLNLDSDYRETKPQIGITVNQGRAATLGVPVSIINTTLESMLGSRRVTTYIDGGEEYDVILESEKDLKRSPLDITNIYVRSERSGELLPLSNLVTLSEFADATQLNRYNRLRSITIEAALDSGYTLGEALEYLENLVRTELPSGVVIDYKGESLELKESGYAVYSIFLLALIVVYLVMAGQFESFVHPVVIMTTVPLAVTGALLALFVTGQTLNIYSEIGLIILIGLAAKNGILIIEFINQLRDEGIPFHDAVLEASGKRLRPILMTGLTTAMGAIPLIISSGAGAETRLVIGVVIFAGALLSMVLTLFIVPVMYTLLAKNTTSPYTVTRELETLLKQYQRRI